MRKFSPRYGNILWLSLFFWRQGSYISNILNSDNVIAKVGNTSISTSKFNRVLNTYTMQLNNMIQDNDIKFISY